MKKAAPRRRANAAPVRARAVFFRTDVTLEADIKAVIAKTVADFGRL